MTATERDYERRFRRAGLPRFIVGFTAWEDVFTRLSPYVVLISVGEVVLALNPDWPWWANLATIVLGLVSFSGGLALLSRRRTGHWSLLPSRVGRAELAFFVLVAPLIQLAAGGNWSHALTTLGANVALLALCYLVTAFGVIPTAVATLTVAASELAGALGRLVRTLPFLLVFSIVIFASTEMWQIFAHISVFSMTLLTAFFALIMAALVLCRLPSLIGDLDQTIRQGSDEHAGVGGPPLERGERSNIGILMWVSQLTQVVAVSAGVGAFFCFFGVLTVPAAVRTAWIGDEPIQWVWRFTVGGSPYEFTNVHLRVALAIACITGVYYAVTVMADRSYRREFVDGLADELAPVFADRAAYRTMLADTAASAAPVASAAPGAHPPGP